MDMSTEFFVVINIIANTIICLGMTAFFVLLFGNGNSIIYKWPTLQHWSLKIALVSIIATSAWNAMNVVYKMVVPRGDDIIRFAETPIGEVLMNCGLALLFVWVVYFHRYHFAAAAPPAKKVVTKKKAAKKKTRPRKSA